jgi:hypothetical protein
LSGWPSVTDSEVRKSWLERMKVESFIVLLPEGAGWRPYLIGDVAAVF